MIKSRHVLTSAFLLCVLANDLVLAQDWPSRGGSNGNNPVVEANKQLTPIPSRDEIDDYKWSALTGMSLDSEPAISDGLVWIGGNNYKPRDPEFTSDAGVLFCFRESDGKFLYQHVSPRHPGGRQVDWPGCGIASTPYIDGDRLYFCTNRCETVCLDIGPLIDGTGMPTEVWKVDMREKFGVYPGVAHIGCRHLHCSPTVWNDYVYVNTTHTVASYQLPDIPANTEPAPSLVCFDKKTGKVIWSDNSSGNHSFSPQWSNPTVIQVGGKHQVMVGQGDGWVRSFDCETGELIWKFDINEKSARLELEDKNPIYIYLRQAIAEPVFHNGRLYLVGGADYESGTTTGRLCCINPSGTGDLSTQLLSEDGKISENPNSSLIWEFTGSESGEDGYQADIENPNVMHASFGSVAVHDGLVIAADLYGSVHCLDEETGTRLWSYDALSKFFGSPLILGKTIIVASEDGEVLSLPLSAKLSEEKIRRMTTDFVLHSSPIYANNVVYFNTYSSLIAIPCEDYDENDD